MNYFDPKNTAERYSQGRPYFHSESINRIKNKLQICEKLDTVLDVACGTGLSSKALLDLAVNVYATDSSIEMLKYASCQDEINYSIAQAESQPFGDNKFDLITVCSGVHWFQIDAFLIEANRLLKKKGYLILYDNFFISEMEDVKEFSNWFPDIYLKKFPSPKRNDNFDWSIENLGAKNFILNDHDEFKNQVSFTKEELMLYFTTQSNITNSINQGQTSYLDVEDWLSSELDVFFKSQTKTRIVNFGNWIKYLQIKDQS